MSTKKFTRAEPSGAFEKCGLVHRARDDRRDRDNREGRNARGGYNRRTPRERILSKWDLDKVYNDIENGSLLSGSSDIIEKVETLGFVGLLYVDLWPELDTRVKFLRVIVATISTGQADMAFLRTNFFIKVLDSKLIATLIDENITPVAYRPASGTPLHATLIDLLLTLLTNGLEVLPTRMATIIPRVQTLIMTLKNLDDFMLATSKLQLQKLSFMIEDYLDGQSRAHDPNSSKAAKSDNVAPRHESRDSVGGPPNDFRTIPITARDIDINLKNKVYLRSIKERGAYASDEDYLDTQFRLLREDYLRPLRQGIEEYHKAGGSRAKNTGGLYVYRNVKILRPKVNKETGEVLNYVQFQQNAKMRWDKRMKYGSLLCLSVDDFNTEFVFGIAMDRDKNLLHKGIVGVKIEGYVDFSLTYNMVESPAFFESYRHVMTALQSYKLGDPIPFSRYVVNVNTNTKPPKYLANAAFKMDLRKAISDERQQHFAENTIFDLRDVHNHLHPQDFGMDQSQFEAFCYALTNDLAIVQGPPGTGKTYLGLEIARVLFDNINLWNAGDKRPMLIVCYTNHALDQFLEGISNFLDTGIVRVGGQSKNPAMEKFMIHNIRTSNHQWLNNRLKCDYFGARNDCQQMAKLVEKVNAHIARVRSGTFFPCDFSNLDFVKHLSDSTNLHKTLDDKKLIEVYCKLEIDLLKSESSLDDWLKQTSPIQRKKMDIDLVRMLMQKFGFSEIFAMNISYKCGEEQLHTYEDILEYLEEPEIENYIYLRIPKNRLLPEIAHWPSLAQIYQLMAQDISFDLAFELLTDSRRTFAHVQREHANWKNNLANNTAVEPTQEDNFLEDIYDDDKQAEHAICDNLFKIVDKQNKNTKKKVESNDMKKIYELIRMARPMTEEETKNITDIWALPLQERWRLCKFCLLKREVFLIMLAQKMEDKFCASMRKYHELRSLADVDVMKGAKVIGMTTTGAARSQAALRSLRSRIVIVEEAAEVFEAHIMVSLTMACEHLILIGDHQQLRPSPASYELEKNFNFGVSFFERMINNGYPYKQLQRQHRMRPEISRTLMPLFYKDLKDHESVKSFPNVLGMKKNLFFVNHNYPETTDEEFKSHKNVFEAKYCVRLALYFLQQNYDAEDITILCTYLDQKKEIKTLAWQMFNDRHNIRIETVDNYQGEECKIIILSLVRSNNSAKRIGFLSIENRVCVALSRAKHGLFVLANVDFLAENCKSDLWMNIHQRLESAECLGEALPIKCETHDLEQLIYNALDFDTKSPEGGCFHPCNYRKDCGHVCRMPCHVVDMNHTTRKCMEKCAKSCSAGHSCQKRCHEDCGDCFVQVDKLLPCLHMQRAKCHLPPEKIFCEMPCIKVLSCGHPCKSKCGKTCDVNLCQAIVVKKLPRCGHEIKTKCSSRIDEYKCKQMVERTWPICGHTAMVECHKRYKDIACEKSCVSIIDGCEHLCVGNCGTCRNGRLHVACESTCHKILICGHECQSKCLEACPPCKRACETACEHSYCGSDQRRPALVNEKDLKQLTKTARQNNKKKNDLGRLCGEECPPCAEKCLNACAHRLCSNRCSEICDVTPCKEPCKIPLPCSPKRMLRDQNNAVENDQSVHYCPSVCGDDCIKICKICEPEKFSQLQEIFFGTEDDEDARFIQLKDCGHIFEVKSFDTYITDRIEKRDGSAIIIINCPRCNTPIRRSKRYISLLNKNALSIEKIKLKIRGDKKNVLKEKLEALQFDLFNAELRDDGKLFGKTKCKKNDWGLKEALRKVGHQILNAKDREVSANWLVYAQNIFGFMKLISKFDDLICENITLKTTNWMTRRRIFDILSVYSAVPMDGFLYRDLRDLTERLQINRFSNRFCDQFERELNRFHFMFELMNWLASNTDELDEESGMLLKEIFNQLHSAAEFHGDFKEALEKKFEKLKTYYYAPGYSVSKMELVEIKHALSNHITNWFECPNGHPYGIGHCGGAMENALCGDCKAPIGGTRHRVHDGNRESDLNEHPYSFPLGLVHY